jgi:hypothetical protein
MMQLITCDLDGALTEQNAVRRRLATGRGRVLPMRGLGAGLRLWSTESTYAQFARAWHDAWPATGPRTTSRGAQTDTPVILYGSGDYHHLASVFLEAVDEPITVLHFDNHPDWSWCLQRRHCGSWVLEALELPHVERVITIGPCSADIDRPDGDIRRVAALMGGQHVVFPWQRPDTAVSPQLPSGIAHTVRSGMLSWQNLAGCDWMEFVASLRTLVPTRKVWLSIDKDVLGPRDAVTNWDQGQMSLDQLVTAIARIGHGFCIAGVDICGDYSESHFSNPLKSIEAWFDQPSGIRGRDLAINDRTNEILLGVLEDIL